MIELHLTDDAARDVYEVLEAEYVRWKEMGELEEEDSRWVEVMWMLGDKLNIPRTNHE